MVKKTFEIICGTYEEYLLGFLYNYKMIELSRSFAAHDHSASIRCLAYSDQYLATGAADDRIIIYDIKSRKEHCMLTHHDSTVSCIQFTPNHSHILSGSVDGYLAIVRTGNWQLEKMWEKPHKGSAVLDIAVHSSGKLALTLGADCSLCTWNLVKGRRAFVVNLSTKCKDAKSIEKILWCQDGVRFLLFGGKYTEIWSIETGGPLKQIEHSEKVVSSIWLDDEHLLVGYENGSICKLRIDNETKIIKKVHESRVKAIALYKSWIVSGSSNGEIKVLNEQLEEVFKHEAGCRITCLCVVPYAPVKKEKIENESELTENVIPVDQQMKKAAVVIIEEDEDESRSSEVMKSNKKKEKRISVIEEKMNESIKNDLDEDKFASTRQKGTLGKMKKKQKFKANTSEERTSSNTEVENIISVEQKQTMTKKKKKRKGEVREDMEEYMNSNIDDNYSEEISKKKRKKHRM